MSEENKNKETCIITRKYMLLPYTFNINKQWLSKVLEQTDRMIEKEKYKFECKKNARMDKYSAYKINVNKILKKDFAAREAENSGKGKQKKKYEWKPFEELVIQVGENVVDFNDEFKSTCDELWPMWCQMNTNIETMSRICEIIPEWMNNEWVGADSDEFIINTFAKMVKNYSFDLVREACESEAVRKNFILSSAYTKSIELMKENGGVFDYKEHKSIIKELIKSGLRVKGSYKGSMFDDMNIESPLGGYGSYFSQTLANKYWDCVKKGLLYGKVSLPNFKLDSPFTITSQHSSLTKETGLYVDSKTGLKEKEMYFFNVGSRGTSSIFKFVIDMGTQKNRDELSSVLEKFITGEYKLCGSTMTVNRKNKIELNLTMEIPKQKVELDENVVVGVDIGIAIPAMCALNTNDYVRLSIGSARDFTRKRAELVDKKRRAYKAMATTGCNGHGRKKKMKYPYHFSDQEKRWARTYNHYVSKQVIKFALDNRAKYINIEDLRTNKDDVDNFILKNWTYYRLQQDIMYKAQMYGIEVRKVNACYTSQVCSCCGKVGIRDKQAEFVCTNPKCKVSKKAYINADFNAARNIALSPLITDGKSKIELLQKQARAYYGIVDKTETEEEE